MKQYLYLSENAPGCTVGIVNTLLAMALMFSSMGYMHPLNYLRQDDVLSCRGYLGAGFPVSFLCDYASGGSPISSWGRIDLADFPYFSLPGLVVDLLFYSMQVWGLWFILANLFHQGENRRARRIWALLIGTGYLIGFVSALVMLQTVHIQIDNTHLDTPTAVLPSPTPFGTPPPLQKTPLPTTQT